MKILFVVLQKLRNFFSRKKSLGSSQQVHWVNHICDRYVNASKAAVGGYANLHGFQEGSPDNWVYWVGVDMRSFGIRVQDVVIRCKNKSTYDYWIDKATRDLDSIPRAVMNDERLYCRSGSDTNIQFIFKWGGQEKTFDVHLSFDRYAEQK